MFRGVALQVTKPNQPFIIRVNDSGRAIRSALQQLFKDDGKVSLENARPDQTRPVAFMSRKLSTSLVKTWDVREVETYAMVSALEKWAGWIGLQPVLVLTDHKAIEAWSKDVLITLSGVSGRRARWHEKLSRFKITIVHVPGKDNVVGDALSRYAYPASQAFADVSWHGSVEDDLAM